MGDRNYEAFLLRQVKRSNTIYTVLFWLCWLLVAACIAMFIIAMIKHISLAKALALLPAMLGFIAGSSLSKTMRKNYATAMNEMDYGITHLKYRLPEEYSGETRKYRFEAAKALRSLRSLIIAYGILALVLLAGAIVIICAANPGGAWFEPILFVLSGILIAMAIPLAILTILNIRELPASREFTDQINATVASEGQE